MQNTAQIAVSNATYSFDKLYTYTVPAHLQSTVHVGSMVLVPFGRGVAKPRMGVVISVGEGGTYEAKAQPEGAQQACTKAQRLKAIYDVAPETARLSPELLKLVHSLKQTTFCTYYDAVKAIIPYGAQYKSVSTEAGFKLQKQIIRHTENFYKRVKAPEKFTEKQKKAWDIISDNENGTSQSELEQHGVTKNVLDRMCEKGYVELVLRQKNAAIYENYTLQSGEINLSDMQTKAYNELEDLRTQNKPCVALLHGVTSSGKTMVFLKLVKQAIKSGKSALILVPEISLTPQMIYKLKSYFGEKVAVQHSALSNTERLLQWQQIQNGEASVVVGTRSAIFAPLENIGVIIIDEEQEHTYHSESSPRFSAHDVAKRRCVYHKALLVLASATPEISSYYYAKKGQYKLVELSARYNKMPLPAVEFTDMRTELASGNAGAISVQLKLELENVLQNKKQAILLLNRRGYQTVGMCTKCAKAIKCEFCSVPMVHHKASEKLMCHYCGNAISPVPIQCPECGEKIKYTGFGTQRVEEELSEKLPGARILRMDADSTSKKNSHEKLLGSFGRGEYDIMLGTQMVAKGLDFKNVTLVGVLGIDQLLFAQGYKAFENVFSLITQVVGRSGRSEEPGKAIIQTVDPEHPVLKLAAKQDYTTFYSQEIQFRKLNLYPPYCAVCMIGFSGENEKIVVSAAKEFSRLLKEKAQKTQNLPLRILGPAPMNIMVVKNKYRYKLTVKCRNDKMFRATLCEVLDKYAQTNFSEKAPVFVNFNSNADV